MTDDVRVPLRQYLEDQEKARREWMVEKFATKDDLRSLDTRLAVVESRAKASGAKWGGLVSAAVSGVVMAAAALLGLPKQQ